MMMMTMVVMEVEVMVMMMIAWPLPEELATVSKEATRMFPRAVVWPGTFTVSIIIIIIL